MKTSRFITLVIIGILAVGAFDSTRRASADTVLAGYDLFTTQPGTSFAGVPFRVRSANPVRSS